MRPSGDTLSDRDAAPRRERMSVQTGRGLDAQLDEIADAWGVRPAQVASMLLAQAAAQALMSVRAARGQPIHIPPPAPPTPWQPSGLPAAASPPAHETPMAAAGQPAGIPSAAERQSNPSHSLGVSLTREDSSERESERENGKPTCPECSGALVVRWVKRAQRDKLGCENFDERKATKAGLAKRCGYMREIDDAAPAPSLARTTAETRAALREAKATKAAQDAEGAPSPFDAFDPSRLRKGAMAGNIERLLKNA